MRKPALRRAIARRTYDLVNPDGTKATVSLVFSAPVRSGDSHTYYCFYRVQGLACDSTRFGAGADAVQALLLATVNAATDLYKSPEWKAGRLTHEGSRNLGLPLIPVGDEGQLLDHKLELVL